MSYRINTSQIGQARKRLRATIQAAKEAEYRTVNTVARSTRTAASRAIRNEVRLKASYVNENLTVTRKATRNNPEAIISGRKRPTRLARFGARQLTQSAPGARGDTSRGIDAGRKQAGVSVHVKRSGSRKKMRGAFLVPLRTNGRMGVFVREGNGIRHLYSASVDQVFAGMVEDLKPQIRRDLAREYSRQLALLQREGR